MDITQAAIVGRYEPSLVALSVIIAIVTVYVALQLSLRITHIEPGNTRRQWLSGGSVIMGCGIWSTHFVGMLAFRMPMPVSYDSALTLLSILIAIAASGLALSLVSRPSTVLLPWFSGILMGLGIAAMHYIGMAAMRMPAYIEYDMGLVLLSILIAVTVAIVALSLASRSQGKSAIGDSNGYKLAAAVTMGLAIAGMHYTGMAAVTFIAVDNPAMTAELSLGDKELAAGVGIFIFLVLLISTLFISRESRFITTISAKVTTLTFTVAAISAGTIGLVFYQYIQEALIDKEIETLTEEVHIEAAEIKSLVQTLRQDVLFLSQTADVQGIIQARAGGRDPVYGSTEQEWRDRYAIILDAFLKSKPDYLQARYIGVGAQGRELVRVERDGNKVVRVPEHLLQAKSDTEYFQSTVQLEAGQVYLSDVTLNREHGHITKPYRPTMRAAVPIFSAEDTVFGIVVINMDFSRLLDALLRSRRQGDYDYVTNDSGDLLGVPNESEQYFGFEFGHRWRIQDQYPELAGVFNDPKAVDATLRARLPEDELLVHIHKVRFDPDNPARYLALAEGERYSSILERTGAAVNRVIALTVFLVALATLLALLQSRVITHPLRAITNATEKFANGDISISLPQHTQGEIGILARSFTHMVEKVNEHTDQLRQSETFIRNVINSAADGIITINSDGSIRSFNRAAEFIFGFQASEVIGKNVSMLMPEPHRSKHDNYIDNYLQTGHARVIGNDREVEGQHKDGSVFPLDLTITKMLVDEQTIFIGLVRDISERKRAEKELRLAAKVMDTSLEAIMITDSNNNIQSINHTFTAITGYSEEETLNKNPRILQSGKHDRHFYEEMWNTLKQTNSWQGEIWDRRKNGEIYPKWLSISVIKDNDGAITNHVAMFSDITERKLTEDRLFHAAHYDLLTQLPNRLLFNDRLEQAIERAGRKNWKLALLFLDLDNFKVINDTLGHDIGDELICQVASRLKTTLWESDTVARLAGDEFTVIVENIKDNQDAILIANKIVNTLSQPFQLKGQERFATASIGVSIFPEDGDDSRTLLKHADVAMYRAKIDSDHSFQLYKQEMSAGVSRRLDLETQLYRALDRGEFELYYQPQISLPGGDIVGVEALLRWHNSTSGEVSPAEFIPIAESTGLICPIGEWVLQEACSQHRAWLDKGISNLRIAVNVSAKQLLNNKLPGILKKLLTQYGIEPRHLELELTESVFMENPEQATALLQEIKQIGSPLSLDDFGTGHSSLSKLKNLPFQTVKIDRSFVSDITSNPDDAEIAQAIIAMSHSLKRTVVAEGVETQEQLAYLMEMQCDIVQGYFFSRPVSAQEMEKLLTTSNPWKHLEL